MGLSRKMNFAQWPSSGYWVYFGFDNDCFFLLSMAFPNLGTYVGILKESWWQRPDSRDVVATNFLLFLMNRTYAFRKAIVSFSSITLIVTVYSGNCNFNGAQALKNRTVDPKSLIILMTQWGSVWLECVLKAKQIPCRTKSENTKGIIWSALDRTPFLWHSCRGFVGLFPIPRPSITEAT